jgi:hypothetical protein
MDNNEPTYTPEQLNSKTAAIYIGAAWGAICFAIGYFGVRVISK